MTVQSPLRKALRYYRENGAFTLAQSTFNYLGFAGWPVVGRAIDAVYPRFIVPSEELKSEYCSQYWELEDDLDGLHYGLNEKIAPLQDDPLLSYNYYPRFAFKQPFVAEVPNISVAGPYASAFTDDGKVLLDPHNSFTPGAGWRTGGAIKTAISDVPLTVGTALLRGHAPEPTRTVPIAALVHDYWGNFYHWTLEELLKLRGVQQYEQTTGREVPIIIPSDPKPYITESLRLLGYDEDDYIEWDGEPLGVKQLVVPSFPDPTPRAIEWLRNEITSGIDLSDETSPDWVYVSRQNASKRRVVNYEEVLPVLEQYGVQPVECETLSLEKQIRLFSGVDGIIGPHGAGLTGMIWGSDIRVVEVFNNVVKGPYYVLAHVLGHDYTALSADPVGDAHSERERDVHIEPNKLAETLDRRTN
ncbi:glycosyltransferase family 61 protein [Halostella salina]|uniref:glycosyltransferase family 61 protein n=1 Tax=Halostella salina TaxID=1547897 RepID=UPI000EF7991D|nr:glycosyltransferase family 61 protein [Halostella salina]